MTREDIIKYYLSKDNKKLFNHNIIVYKDKKCYEGDIRMDIYLFLTREICLKVYNSLKNISEIFLDKIFFSLENASIEGVISIACENPKWFNSSAIDEHKNRYKGLIEALHFS